MSFQGHTDDYKKTSINILSTTTYYILDSIRVFTMRVRRVPNFFERRKPKRKKHPNKGGDPKQGAPKRKENKKGKRNFHLMGQSNLYFYFHFEKSSRSVEFLKMPCTILYYCERGDIHSSSFVYPASMDGAKL